MTAALEARALSLAVPGRTLLQGLDWRAQAGERWCVLGRNAAGKSTLLRALAGLDVPQFSGEVRWQGRPVGGWTPAEAARRRAYQPQQAQDRFGLPVRRVLELSRTAQVSEVAGLLAQLDIEGLPARDVRTLSGGERQRVALAQCAVQGAAVWLLDEPVSFQDPAHQRMVGQWLRGQQLHGLVITAHDINWVAEVATHVLMLHGDGRWAAGPVVEMLTAQRLEALYGCPWRHVGGAWLPG